jgi:hypothetical protein
MYCDDDSDVKVVRMLVAAGANVAHTDRLENTALALAQERGLSQIAEELKRHQ